MSHGGLRKVEDEKQLLADFGKLFHTVKANHKERAFARRAKKESSPATANKKKEGGGDGNDGSKRMRKKNTSGGSVWIVLKGGFSNRSVPSLSDTARVNRKCAMRGGASVARRVEALTATEAYVASAWAAAVEAGIVTQGPTSNGTPSANCEEGVTYMRDQFVVAVQMLDEAQRRTPGATLRALVEASVRGGGGGDGAVEGKGKAAAAAAAAAAALPAFTAVESVVDVKAAAGPNGPKVNWEDIAARELAIRQNPFTTNASMTSSSGSGVAAAELLEEQYKAVVSDAGKSYYYRLGEPSANSTSGNNNASDIAATKCIVRIRNSQRQKHTAILSTPRAVNYFRSNFMLAVRKELNASKLPRGVEESDGQQQQQQKQQQQPKQQQQQQQKGGKKRGRR